MNDLIEKLSNLRSQFNCFNNNEREVYHTLSEAIKMISERPEPCEDVYFIKKERLDYVVDILDQIKESNPNQTIIIETPGKSVSCKLKDALIYIGAKNEIVIDAE